MCDIIDNVPAGDKRSVKRVSALGEVHSQNEVVWKPCVSLSRFPFSLGPVMLGALTWLDVGKLGLRRSYGENILCAVTRGPKVQLCAPVAIQEERRQHLHCHS